MFNQILVPLDGSVQSEQVLPLAAALARQQQAHLILVKAITEAAMISSPLYAGGAYVGEEVYKMNQAMQNEAHAYLTKLVAHLTAQGISASSQVVAGYTAEVIEMLAGDCSLLLMATHGRTGLRRTLLGSVALDAVQHSERPALLVGPHVAAAALADCQFRQILVPLDGSPFAEQALPLATAFAEQSGGSLVLLELQTGKEASDSLPPSEASEDYQVTDLEATTAYRYLDSVASRFIPEAVPYVAIASRGNPVRGIVAVARQQSCDLIVMATHSRSGLPRLLKGSVTEQVLHDAPVPVLVLRGASELEPKKR